jgi:serine/threonine protein kinase
MDLSKLDEKIVIDNFKICYMAGEGQIGQVYNAKRQSQYKFVDERAIKIIPKSKKINWENEIDKVVQLTNSSRRLPVVGFINCGETDVLGEKYWWIAWEWCNGKSLRYYIDNNLITVPVLRTVVNNVLEVLHGCKELEMQHGDLHPGNILIEEPSQISINQEYRALVTDFGYLSISDGKDILDDFLGLSNIINECVKQIDFHLINNGEDRKYFSTFKNYFSRYLLESNHVEGEYVRNPEILLKQIDNIIEERFNSNKGVADKKISDYLAAELLGVNYKEWEDIFVPDFLAISSVLDRNISVITGLRGCGKTTIFRRLSALFNCHLGPVPLSGANDFIGFYFNARSLAEAFPWLPEDKIPIAQNQIIKFFNASWSLDIITWLIEESKKRKINFRWLYDFFNKKLDSNTIYLATDSLYELRNRIGQLIIKSKLSSKYTPDKHSDLNELDFLEQLTTVIKDNCPWISQDVFYFFLDDYSTPMISSRIQAILNSIVFRRSSQVIFKVATESVESFYPIGLNGKKLEEKDDYILVDFGAIMLLNDANNEKVNIDIISAVLQKRVERCCHSI